MNQAGGRVITPSGVSKGNPTRRPFSQRGATMPFLPCVGGPFAGKYLLPGDDRDRVRFRLDRGYQNWVGVYVLRGNAWEWEDAA